MVPVSISQANFAYFLDQLEHILQNDPLIDEVGFVHPSQLAALHEETSGLFENQPSNMLGGNIIEKGGDTIFWTRDHKLAISTEALLPLYTAAKYAFKTADAQYKMVLNLSRKADVSMDETSTIFSSVSKDYCESEMMKHSKALLLLSSDFATAWNSRKLVLSEKQHVSHFMDEFLLSALVLSYSPKSEHAWSHRRWVIKSMTGKYPNLQDIVDKESELVERIAEKYKMNYRAWYHRCWLVSFMTSRQLLEEFNKSRKWSELHVADNCCFHYRQQLLIRMFSQSFLQYDRDGPIDPSPDLYHVWKEEIDWDERLIRRYTGREALWVHRRFLAQCWIKHFAPFQDAPFHNGAHVHVNYDMSTFVDNEFQLLNACIVLPNNDFEDGHTQATLALAYILWISKQIPQCEGIKFHEKLRELGDVKALLNELCPEKALLWDGLIQ